MMQLQPRQIVMACRMIKESLKQPPPESDLGRYALAVTHLDDGGAWPPPYFDSFSDSDKATLVEVLIYVKAHNEHPPV